METHTYSFTQRGSALFLILLGIALFAALSFAVTQMMRTSDQSVSSAIGNSEKKDLNVSDVQQFLEAIRLSVQQMTSTQNVPESNIDFKNDVYKIASGAANVANINGNCINDSCHVFMPYNPNGLRPMIFSGLATTPEQSNVALPKNGHGQIYQIAIDGVGSTEPELVFVIHGVQPDFCNYFNQKQGVTTTYSGSTTLTLIGENSTNSQPEAFGGSFNSTHDFGTGATAFAGKKTFCAPSLGDGESNRLSIWHVIKVR